MLRIVCVAALALCLFSCGQTGKKSGGLETIDASLENMKEGESVFSHYSLLSLETADTCLLENIVKVDMQGDAIYLLSSYGGKVYKFTKEGRYVWQLRQGNGPGELVFATDFAVDASERCVYVLDNYRELKVYSLEGECQRAEKLPSLAFLFAKKKDAFLCFEPNLSRKSDFNLSVSQVGSIVMEGLRKSEGNRSVGYMPSSVFAFASDESVYIQHMLSDTIYACSLADKQVSPAYYIHTNGLSVNAHDIHFPDSRSFYQACKENNYVSGLSSFSLCDNKIYLTMFHEGHPLYVVHDTAKGESGVFASLCEGLPNSLRCVGKSDKGLVYCYTMDELMEYADQGHSVPEDLKQLLATVGAEDNPVLVVLK